nr:MAG TPA: hypothetical protein [Caudoviricetes sp.]
MGRIWRLSGVHCKVENFDFICILRKTWYTKEVT